MHNTSGRKPPKPQQRQPAPPRADKGSQAPPTRAPENQGWFPWQWKELLAVALAREELIERPGEAVTMDSVLRQQDQLCS